MGWHIVLRLILHLGVYPKTSLIILFSNFKGKKQSLCKNLENMKKNKEKLFIIL